MRSREGLMRAKRKICRVSAQALLARALSSSEDDRKKLIALAMMYFWCWRCTLRPFGYLVHMLMCLILITTDCQPDTQPNTHENSPDENFCGRCSIPRCPRMTLVSRSIWCMGGMQISSSNIASQNLTWLCWLGCLDCHNRFRFPQSMIPIRSSMCGRLIDPGPFLF